MYSDALGTFFHETVIVLPRTESSITSSGGGGAEIKT